MLADVSSGELAERPVRIGNIKSLVVRDANGTPVAVFHQLNPGTMTYASAGDPKFKEALAAVGFLERVDVILTQV